MSETTIFPVLQGGKVHGAFLLDEDTDAWSTKCGHAVEDPTMVQVQHTRVEVECQACCRQMARARRVRAVLRRQYGT